MSMLFFAVLLPHMIMTQTTENEKYQQVMTPSQSLYCNDLNPQTHVDFTLVKLFTIDV